MADVEVTIQELKAAVLVKLRRFEFKFVFEDL